MSLGIFSPRRWVPVMRLPRTLVSPSVLATAALLASLAVARPSAAQDYATIIESRHFPLENRSRTLIVEEDLTPRSYLIVMAPHTRVIDNHAEIVARRGASSFEARFEESVERQAEIYALYRRLSR